LNYNVIELNRPTPVDGGDGMWNWFRAVRPAPSDRGTATTEYAIVTVAACSFAGALLAILRSGGVHDLLFGIIRGALNVN
jgi:hypothetical protein